MGKIKKSIKLTMWEIRGGYPELSLHSCKKTSEMVNFMCQLNWAIGFLDIWPNIILGVFG